MGAGDTEKAGLGESAKNKQIGEVDLLVLSIYIKLLFYFFSPHFCDPLPLTLSGLLRCYFPCHILPIEIFYAKPTIPKFKMVLVTLWGRPSSSVEDQRASCQVLRHRTDSLQERIDDRECPRRSWP